MIIRGKDLLVFTGEEDMRFVACSTSCELDISREAMEVAAIGSSGWREYIARRMGWTVTVSALLFEEGENAQDWQARMEAGEPLYLTFSTSIMEEGRRVEAEPDGRFEKSGTALLTRLTYTGNNGNAAAFSAEFQGTGALVTRMPIDWIENEETWMENRETLLTNDTAYGQDI